MTLGDPKRWIVRRRFSKRGSPEMAKRQVPKRIFHSREVVTPFKNERAPARLLRNMSEEHVDVLENIEFILVRSHREDPDVDDRTVDMALRACMDGVEPADRVVAEIVDRLEDIRGFRKDIPDDVWRNALRVVARSITNHSRLQPGETGYLSFVSQYVR
jgi:hypothetical protein